MDIVRWPRVLCVQLKRFAYSRRDGSQRKVLTLVQWQEYENFHGGQQACPYRLRCVVNHGGMRSGHYTSYIRGHCGEWYLCNDAEAPRRVNLREVLGCEGYMAFYEREGVAPN